MSEVALFDVEPGTPPERAGTPVAKTFRRFEPDQVLLLPPSLDEWLPADHLARFVAELVDGVLDLSGIYADYTEARGYPPYEPRMMVRLLVYGYTTVCGRAGQSSGGALRTSRSATWPPGSARTSGRG